MKFTIRAKPADDISPMIVATEDPVEALESVKAFGREKLTAVILDEIGREIEMDELERFIQTQKNSTDTNLASAPKGRSGVGAGCGAGMEDA